MAFKKSLAALILTLPLVLGMNLFFSKNVDDLTMITASPSQVRANPACEPLEAIKTDLLENLFDNECGDTVSFLSSNYEHLSIDRTGSWCSASRFPWCYRNFSDLRVITFTLVLSHCWFLGKKTHQRRRSWWIDHYFQWNRVLGPRKRWNWRCSRRDQSFLLQTCRCYNPGRLVRILRD